MIEMEAIPLKILFIDGIGIENDWNDVRNAYVNVNN